LTFSSKIRLTAVLSVRISALFIASETAPEDVTFKVVMLGAVSWDCQKELCEIYSNREY